MRASLRLSVAAALIAFAAWGCASRKPIALPSLPATLKYPDFVYPSVPQALRTSPDVDRVDLGWRYLQNDDLGSAEREFGSALKRSPALFPAQAGEGYVAMARQKYDQAVSAFDAALARSPNYVPALVGRGQSLLALKRDSDALTSFEAALAADASLTDLRRRVEVLRFRNLGDTIEEARRDAAAGRLEASHAAYQRAIAASPESAFLYRERGLVERKQNNAPAALASFRRATELDASDNLSWAQVGELLEAQQDFAGAEAAYRKALAVEPSDALTARVRVVAEKAREARLPAEFRAISDAPQITRGDLAALIGIRLEAVLRNAPEKQVVVTDARGNWAAPWIATVARAGVVEPFENHTFQPRTRVRRVDLATAVSRVVTLLAAQNPSLRAKISERPKIADVSPGHLAYPAVSVAVASGILPLLDGQRFQVSRPVSGAEAVAAVDRLRALAPDGRLGAP